MTEWKLRTAKAMLMMALFGLAGCRFFGSSNDAAPVPASSATPAPLPTVATLAPQGSLDALVSFYGWGDDGNGTHIAHPRSSAPGARHERAGGTGTWRDPITFAGDTAEFPVGTVIWVPMVRKYFVMEDDCQMCGDSWRNDGHRRVELWTGTANPKNVAAEEDCETALTPQGASVQVVVAPPPNEPVSKKPLFDATRGKCFVAVAAAQAAPTATPIPLADDGSHPSWIDGAVIYDVYPEIFSPSGNLAGVTAQLPRLHGLGINVLWLMPVFPVGLPYKGHPAFDSPYAVSDYTKINPRYGTAADLAALVKSAHGLGIKVILDVPLNQTSWDNPLVARHPEFYLHSDGNRRNPRSIKQAFDSPDAAQLDYKSSNGLADYMTAMLQNLLKTYDIDGFRFDLADNPPGDDRMIPASFWQGLRPQLESIKPDILMLGQEENQTLMTQPFELDYGWQLQRELVHAAANSMPWELSKVWKYQHENWAPHTMHMSFLQDWDLDEDLRLYGKAPAAKAAAVFDFTIDGVPMLWNGEEVGNDRGGVDTHQRIDWNAPMAADFTDFYQSLIGLRDANTALQQGTLRWLSTSNGYDVLAYDRSDPTGEFVVEINFSPGDDSGTITNMPNDSLPYPWTEIPIAGSPGKTVHSAPPNYSLGPYDFAVFRRGT